MHVYADHNFLISCAEYPAWRDALIEARNSDKCTMVLSPWHFYEIGKARSRNDLLDLAELINPKWILERSDIQLVEFQCLWNSIWTGTNKHVTPIQSLEEVAAALHRTSVQRVEKITIRDYVRGFTKESLRETLTEARVINDRVRAYSQAGILTETTKREIERAYIALQIARAEGIVEPDAVYSRIPEILSSQPFSIMIDTFIYWQLLDLLKAYKVEKELSREFYNTPAVLNANRMVDRQHAVAALSYCDYFVTDDQDLIERCRRASEKIRFKVAAIQTAKEFLQLLKAC